MEQRMKQEESGKSFGRSFFGKDSCMRIEHNTAGTWMSIGHKNGNGWQWKKAKLSPVELGDILTVLNDKTDKVSFFHSFKQKDGERKETKIFVSRAEDSPSVFFRIEEHAKPLNLGEQEVLKTLLHQILFKTCESNWQTSQTQKEEGVIA